MLAASDAEHLECLRAQGRVIFTQDADFLRLSAAGEPHPGIVYCHQQSRSIGEIIRALLLIWELLEPAEMSDRVEYI